MSKVLRGGVLTLALLCAAAAHGQAPPPEPPAPTPPPAQPPVQPPAKPPRPAWKDKLYFGGGVGLSFGDIDYVELAPLVGYRVHPRVATGVRVFYRWKSDDRYDVDTSDYGGNLFAHLTVWRGWFVAGEYEYVDYEYATFSGATFRDSDSNVLGGVGFSRRAGGRAGLYAEALYNFSYDDNDPLEPYDSPWVYRVGVTFGF